MTPADDSITDVKHPNPARKGKEPRCCSTPGKCEGRLERQPDDRPLLWPYLPGLRLAAHRVGMTKAGVLRDIPGDSGSEMMVDRVGNTT